MATRKTKAPSKERAITQAVKSVSPPPATQNKQEISEYVRRLRHMSDNDLAVQAAIEFADNVFEQQYGQEYATLVKRRETLEQLHSQRKAIMIAALERVVRTDPFVYMEDPHTKKTDSKPFKEWGLADKVGLCLCLAGAVATAGIGFSNVYAAMMASGEPIYIEQPLLPALTACSLPLASLAIERLNHFFKTDQTKHRYTLGIFSSTAVFAILWVLAFSTQFSSAGGDIDLMAIVESSGGKSDHLVRVQLLLEVFTASSLGLAVDSIVRRHSPDNQNDSPQLVKHEKAFETAKAKFDEVDVELNDCLGRIAFLDSERDHTILHHVSDHLAVSVAHNQSQHF